MAVILTKEQRTWLQQQVDAGTLPSVEDGLRVAVAHMKNIADDDFAWVKPFVEKPRESVARGDLVDGDTVIAELEKRASS